MQVNAQRGTCRSVIGASSTCHRATAARPPPTLQTLPATTMEVLHSQLANLQRHLAWVSTEPLDWKLYVQAFSWSVYLFESYLTYVRTLCVSFLHWHSWCRLRQYPLYSKTAPPAELSAHIDSATFAKSQQYGRDKARFSIISGLIHQVLDTVGLHFGIYAFAWESAGHVIARFGYGPEYEVRLVVTV